MKKIILLLILTLCAPLFPSATIAAEQTKAPIIYGAQDSYFFTRDDGEMSDEEMDLEALYVYKECNRNILKKVYYNCECVAGAFRQLREDEGPITPQTHLTREIYQNSNTSCANITAIAGDSYQECLQNSSAIRVREKNNEEYCSCVGNKVANDFVSFPRLKSYHIKNIKVGAMLYCNDPNNLIPYEKKVSAR